MHVALPPENTSGRSKYGMGLKTAACWLGNNWTVRTKKLGESEEHEVTLNVDEIANGNRELPYKSVSGKDPSLHYTVIEITDHNRKFHGRTIGKIKEFLGSMYREDFRNQVLKLEWQGSEIRWDEPELLVSDTTGEKFKKEFEFYVEGDKKVWGWLGILKRGTRSNAGLSIVHSGRIIRGWPDSWRPSSLFGQFQGSNDLVNQRLVGEIHLDAFQVSHTKDDILWMGDQEAEVEAGLLEHGADLKDFSKIPLKRRDGGGAGPSEVETKTAIDELERELASEEMIDLVDLEDVPPDEVTKLAVEHVTEVATDNEPTLEAVLGAVTVRLYVQNELSPNDPYVAVEATKEKEVVIVVNTSHPHWDQIKGSDGALNYFRHCIYDGIAEWKARRKAGSIEPNTIKMIKDTYLRIPLNLID